MSEAFREKMAKVSHTVLYGISDSLSRVSPTYDLLNKKFINGHYAAKANIAISSSVLVACQLISNTSPTEQQSKPDLTPQQPTASNLTVQPLDQDVANFYQINIPGCQTVDWGMQFDNGTPFDPNNAASVLDDGYIVDCVDAEGKVTIHHKKGGIKGDTVLDVAPINDGLGNIEGAILYEPLDVNETAKDAKQILIFNPLENPDQVIYNKEGEQEKGEVYDIPTTLKNKIDFVNASLSTSPTQTPIPTAEATAQPTPTEAAREEVTMTYEDWMNFFNQNDNNNNPLQIYYNGMKPVKEIIRDPKALTIAHGIEGEKIIQTSSNDQIRVILHKNGVVSYGADKNIALEALRSGETVMFASKPADNSLPYNLVNASAINYYKQGNVTPEGGSLITIQFNQQQSLEGKRGFSVSLDMWDSDRFLIVQDKKTGKYFTPIIPELSSHLLLQELGKGSGVKVTDVVQLDNIHWIDLIINLPIKYKYLTITQNESTAKLYF